MSYRSALWRSVKMILGLNFEPFEPIDYSPEAQLVRLAKRLEELEAEAVRLGALSTLESLDEWAARHPRER